MPLRTVVHVTPWWNPAARDQATARGYRLGQTHEIEEVNMISAGTIEEHVFRVQQDKERVSRNVFGSADLKRPNLSRQELIELLSRKAT